MMQRRMLMMQMKTNLSTKAMIDILPFCLLCERQNHFSWEMRIELQTFCNMFRNLEVIHCGLLTSFTKVSTLPTEVYVFRGRENC